MVDTLIAEMRMTSIGSGYPFIEYRKAIPVVDASGAVCGFEIDGSWERIVTHKFDSPASYHESVAMDDLAASGGIMDDPDPAHVEASAGR